MRQNFVHTGTINKALELLWECKGHQPFFAQCLQYWKGASENQLRQLIDKMVLENLIRRGTLQEITPFGIEVYSNGGWAIHKNYLNKAAGMKIKRKAKKRGPIQDRILSVELSKLASR